MSLVVILLLHYFNKTVVFDFALCLWDMKSQAPDHLSSNGHELSGLSETRYCLVTPTRFVTPL